MIATALGTVEQVLLWGLVATVAMTTLIHASQGLGFSRLSLSFLVGTLFTGDRARASIAGFVFYTVGGWLFAGFYWWIFTGLGAASWWLGALVGAVHALFLLVVVLPLLPYLHPRMATEYDGPTATRRLEPPGFLGLNYGRRTPLITIAGHVVYGVILGASFSPPV